LFRDERVRQIPETGHQAIFLMRFLLKILIKKKTQYKHVHLDGIDNASKDFGISLSLNVVPTQIKNAK
jgi:hypothetical protein